MEIGRMDWDWKTLSTHELHRIEHFNHPGNALISFVATLRLLRSSAIFCDVVLFYFCVFIVNGSWLNILDLLGVNTAGVLICTSVSACWGILNLFITLLPIRKRAEIELWEIDVIGLVRLDLYLSFLPWLPVLWTPQIEFHPLHAQYQFWLPTGFFGSRDSCLLLAAWTSTVH